MKMNTLFVYSWTYTIATLLCFFHMTQSIPNFQCLKNKGNAPRLPQAYSTNIRINFLSKEYTVEMKYATVGEKEVIEFKKMDRHVKYIIRKDQKSVLFIQYKDDEHPTCKVSPTIYRADFLENEDSGENHILLKALEVMLRPDNFHLYSVEPSLDTGVFAQRYEGCLSEPSINISLSYIAKTWNTSHISYIAKDVSYPEMVFAEIGHVGITAFYSYFDPTTPPDTLFDPPADVYCKGFRTQKVPPNMPDFFSYNAEIIVYESALGIAPIVSQRKVYYDYPSNISRIDFTDPLSQDGDMFSVVTSQKKSIIHDFNSGVQYILNPFTGKCDIDVFQETFNALSHVKSQGNNMLKGNEFFWLKGSETSYNGQFPIRGMTADVYTANRTDPTTKKSFIVSWYFSTVETRVAESESIEKNVLLRMSVRPETDMGQEGVVEINFYDFDRTEPSIYLYDLTTCFNDSSSKFLVFTFPEIESLKGNEKFIGLLIHFAIKDTTGLTKQRIYMKEIIFTGGYMYAEFALLEESPVKGKLSEDDEVSLEDAIKKLEEAVAKEKFIVNIPFSKKENFQLKPEPNGLNIFAGDRLRKPLTEGYKESSVVGLTIGMLILGIVLGAVALNLIISRKFGVSLFQKSKYGNSPFNNKLTESPM